MTASARLFVVSAGGGAPRPLQPALMALTPAAAGHQPPLWSPDGANVLLYGMRAGDPKSRGFWVAPVGGGAAAAIEGLPPWPRWLARYALAWRGEHLYYLEGEPINGSTLFRVRVAPGPWR